MGSDCVFINPDVKTGDVKGIQFAAASNRRLGASWDGLGWQNMSGSNNKTVWKYLYDLMPAVTLPCPTKGELGYGRREFVTYHGPAKQKRGKY